MPIDIGNYKGARIEVEREVARLPVVYRHLNNAGYARDFAERGSFRVSTAGTCKIAEGDARQDRGEGDHARFVSYLSGFDPRASQVIPKWAVNRVVPGMTFTNCTFTSVSDAYLLCLTDLNTPQIRADFGNESIRITNLQKFFWHTVRKMAEEVDLTVATLARVRYGNRMLRDFEQVAWPPMYRKPARFADQNEIRICFQVGNETPRPLKPFVLECEEVARHCTYIDR